MTDTEHDTEHEVDVVDGARIERRDPLMARREDAVAAAHRVAGVITTGDRLRGDLRTVLSDLHVPARTIGIGLAFGLAVWAGGTRELGWPEPRAWIAGLVTVVVVAVLVVVTTVIARRAEPRPRVDLILAPDPGDLRSGMAGSGVTRRDVEACVQMAARRARAAGHLVLDTSGATRPVMGGERVFELLDLALSRADTLVVVAPDGMLTASMRALIRRAVRCGVRVSYWHHDSTHDGTNDGAHRGSRRATRRDDHGRAAR